MLRKSKKLAKKVNVSDMNVTRPADPDANLLTDDFLVNFNIPDMNNKRPIDTARNKKSFGGSS